jgi:SAM-dependent methyltransferase
MNSKHKKEWFDNEMFWKDMYPYLFTEERFSRAPEEVEKILALTKPEGKTALDLCCGPGRCSIAMAAAGFKVTGVDRTEFLLDKAVETANAARITIEWIQMDMRDFIRADAFDLALNVWTSFGYFDDKDEDLQVLSNILTNLKPGGVCLIEVLGKERLAKMFQPTTSSVLPDGTEIIQRHEIVDDWTRIQNEWILIRNGRVKRYKLNLTVYSGQELRDRLEQSGFTDVKLYGNLDGEEYGLNAQRLIAVARKSK